MGIQFDESKRIFHLQTPNTSYVIQLVQDVVPVHLYWGKKFDPGRSSGCIAGWNGTFRRRFRKTALFRSRRCS